jgi:hypothetical protein
VSAPDAAEPRPSTRALWGVLAVLLVLGTVGLATVVYGFTGLLAGDLLAVVPVGVGAVVAAVMFLLMAGLLYRVDRVRGVAHRRVELFE